MEDKYSSGYEKMTLVGKYLTSLNRILKMLGVHPRKTFRAFRALPIFFRNLIILKSQQRSSKVSFPFGTANPCLEDRLLEGGIATGHYFHQDLLVARKVYANNPILHVDAGSRVDGFVAHIASFRSIEVLDIRESKSKVTNITFTQCDLMGDVPARLINYCDSLSCLHALEHFGLGRYGDPVRFDGYLAGLNNLNKILRAGGRLYVSVPIGPQRIEFDAHRVFSVKYLLDLLREKYMLVSFAYVDDEGDLFENAPLTDDNIETNFGCDYGCGIFELIKK